MVIIIDTSMSCSVSSDGVAGVKYVLVRHSLSQYEQAQVALRMRTSGVSSSKRSARSNSVAWEKAKNMYTVAPLLMK